MLQLAAGTFVLLCTCDHHVEALPKGLLTTYDTCVASPRCNIATSMSGESAGIEGNPLHLPERHESTVQKVLRRRARRAHPRRARLGRHAPPAAWQLPQHARAGRCKRST